MNHALLSMRVLTTARMKIHSHWVCPPSKKTLFFKQQITGAVSHSHVSATVLPPADSALVNSTKTRQGHDKAQGSTELSSDTKASNTRDPEIANYVQPQVPAEL